MRRHSLQPSARSPAGEEATPPPGEAALRTAIVTLLVCAGFYACGVIAMALRFEPGQISGVWLPYGLLVAALLLAPVRRWWLYTAALLPTQLHLVRTFQGPVPPLVMVIQFGGNIAQAVLAAALLRRFLGFPPRLSSLSRMGAFIGIGVFLAPCLVSAPVAALFVASDWVGDFWIAWQRRFFTGMCAAVIVVPPVLHLGTAGLTEIRRAPLRLVAEFMLLTAGLIAVLLVSFGWEHTLAQYPWLLFAPLPFLLWSAVRFGPSGLGLHLWALTFVALLNTKAGRGPFAAGSTAEIVVALQGFLLAISIPLMLLSALVQQHAQAAAGLRQSQTQYRSVVEDQTELICRFLPDSTYTFVNGAYCRYFQRSTEELIGQKFLQFLPPEEHAALQAVLASITPDHPVRSIEHLVTGPGGEMRWHHWINRGLFDEAGRIIEYQAVGHDSTERKRAEEEHRQLLSQKQVAEALQEVDRRKDEFLAMLGHELRNPLAPIVLAVDIIRKRTPADDSISWAGNVIARQTAQLKRLVDDLLDVSRITHGKITLDLAELDLGPVIAQAVEATRPLFTARNHELSIDVPDHPLPIRGDGARLTQIISNLLNNAAKYTGDGGRISLRVQEVDSQVVVKVTDNGNGIPGHMLERVFDMFTQLESPHDRVKEGLGIGLALAKRLVDMHGGAIEARSDGPGLGTEVLVRLPLAIAAGDRALLPASEQCGPVAPLGTPGKRILVVDDNLDAAEALSRILRLHEHEVLVVHDGMAALSAARSMDPDVILLDLGLPKLNGLEVARRLRQGARPPRPLLVAITGFGQADDRAATTAAGFDHHLTKPVDPRVLQSLVETAGGGLDGPRPRIQSG